MPIKYKPSEKIVDRATKKVTTVNHFMRNIPTVKLRDDIAQDRIAPKQKQKIRNELVRRGVA